MLLLLMMLQTTDTTCIAPSPGYVSCHSNTNRQPAVLDQGALIRSGRDAAGDYAEQSRRQREARLMSEQADAIAVQNQRQYLYQRVGKLVSDQKCDEAVKVALKGGDFDLAERVKALCK